MRKELLGSSLVKKTIMLFSAMTLLLGAAWFFMNQQSSDAFTTLQICRPVLGWSTPVDVATIDDASKKVANSGVTWFSKDYPLPELNGVDSVPYPEYRACVIDKGPQQNKTDIRYVLEGWAVDTNLGWISFNCYNNLNRLRPCGRSNIDYQVGITEEGVFKGFAYSDVAGWIGFNCDKGFNVMNGKSYACGGHDFKVIVDQQAGGETPPPNEPYLFQLYYGLSTDPAHSHVWSDSVGWFNLAKNKNAPLASLLGGMQVPFGDPIIPPKPECSDGIDNDGDGIADYKDENGDGRVQPLELEPGCHSSDDDDETDYQCNNKEDDDRDHFIDYMGLNACVPVSGNAVSQGAPNPTNCVVAQADPQCESYEDDTEHLITECNDGIDNDGDGRADYLGHDDNGDGDFDDPEDYKFDLACNSALDDSETNHECNNGKDDDGDGVADYLGVDWNRDGDFDDTVDGKKEFEGDDGCSSPDDDDESLEDPPQCSDGIDNDNDGAIDWDGVDLNGDGDFDDTVDGKDEFPPDPGCPVPGKDDEIDPGDPGSPECNDTLDNDTDTLKDFPLDSGCASYEDDDEKDPVKKPQCSDGIDNDDDGYADVDENGDLEPGCISSTDDDETDTECSDHIDNDGNGPKDYPADKGCKSPDDLTERTPECNDLKDNDRDGGVDWRGLWDANGKQVKGPDPQCVDEQGNPDKWGDNESGCDPLKDATDPACIPYAEPGFSLSIMPDPTKFHLPADGESKYLLVLNLVDSQGNIYDNSVDGNGDPIYTFDGEVAPSLTAHNFIDASLFLKQYDSAGNFPKLNVSEIIASDFDFDNTRKVWTAQIFSPVPTFHAVPEFVTVAKSLGAGTYSNLNKSSLDIGPIQFNEIKKGGVLQPGSCDLAAPGQSCVIRAKENPGADITALTFKPVANFSELLADGKKFIKAVVGVKNEIEFDLEYHGNEDVFGSLYPDFIGKGDVSVSLFASAYDHLSTLADHTFAFDWKDYVTSGAAVSGIDATSVVQAKDAKYKNSVSNLVGVVQKFGIVPSLKADSETGSYVGAPSLYTLFEYTWKNKAINYFGAALPDTEVEGIYNPAADIEGLISSKVVVNPQDKDSYYSTGNLTSNVLSSLVNSNIAGILGSKTQFVTSPTSPLVIQQLGSNCTYPGLDAGVVKLNVGGSIFHYVKGQDVVFDPTGGDIHCMSDKDNIVVADGGNVFVDANLYHSDPDAAKWSIVALKSGAGVNQKGGHIYIDKEVTNVHANIVASGSLINYDKSGGRDQFDGDGYPTTPIKDEDNDRQLLIYGSVSSWNTLGGSYENFHKKNPNETDPTKIEYTYVLPSGRYTTDQDAAKKGDLNFLRVFKLYIERCTFVPTNPASKGLPVDQQCKTALPKKTASDQCAVLPDTTTLSCYSIVTDPDNADNDLIDFKSDASGSEVSLRAKGFSGNSLGSDAPVVIRFSAPKDGNPVFDVSQSLGAQLRNF